MCGCTRHQPVVTLVLRLIAYTRRPRRKGGKFGTVAGSPCYTPYFWDFVHPWSHLAEKRHTEHHHPRPPCQQPQSCLLRPPGGSTNIPLKPQPVSASPYYHQTWHHKAILVAPSSLLQAKVCTHIDGSINVYTIFKSRF